MPRPSTPICATKFNGRDGVVDILPRRIDSSYDPTIGACWSGDASEAFDEPRGLMSGVCGVDADIDRENDGTDRKG